MLDLLAAIQAVDPLNWPLWALAAFAAGMYPVGFLFGFGCGECCGCTQCTFHEFAGYKCRQPDTYPNVTHSFSFYSEKETHPEISTSALLGPVGSAITQRLVGTWDVSIAGKIAGENWEATRLSLYARYDGEDRSDCTTPPYNTYECVHRIRFRFIIRALRLDTMTFFNLIDDPVDTTSLVWFDSSKCFPGSVSKSYTAEDFPEQPSDENNTLFENARQYLVDEHVAMTASVTYDACECGACCNIDGQCRDNYVDHLCNGDEEKWKANTTCSGDGCDYEAVCCDYELQCTNLLFEFADCNGILIPGALCASNPCAAVGGACCDPENNCSNVLFEVDCGGTFIPGERCANDPCEA